MSDKAIIVHRWPACGEKLAPVDGLIVIAVETPQTAIRDVARRQVRDAARKILGNLLNCPPTSVNILSRLGQAPQLAGHDDIHLSISHEPGLSLLAINQHGAVGADLLHCPEDPAWRTDILTLAKDYLGPGVAEKFAGIGSTGEVICFAEAWTRHEACLKYLGQGLTEWLPEFAQRFSCCQVANLHLPTSYCGALAVGIDKQASLYK